MSEAELKDRVSELNAKLSLAVEQRNSFAKNFHEVSRVPHQERREIIEDCDRELEQVGTRIPNT